MPENHIDPGRAARKAFITLCTTDPYAVGATVMAQSLKSSNTQYPIYCLVPKNLSERSRLLLLNHLDGLLEVDLIESSDLEYLSTGLKRPDLLHTLTKLHIWSLDGDPSIRQGIIFTPSPHSTFSLMHLSTGTTWEKAEESNLCGKMRVTGWSGAIGFERVVFIDADMLIVRNIDNLLSDEAYNDSFGACPDIGWPDNFNSGLMLICPDHRIYLELLLQAPNSMDGADQGVLNLYYSSWSTDSQQSPSRQRTVRLPFLYNVCFSGLYTYTPAYQYYKDQIRAVHFIGSGNKPWQARRMLRGNVDNGYESVWVLPYGVSLNQDALPYMELWWDIYMMRVKNTADQLGGLSEFGIFTSCSPSGSETVNQADYTERSQRIISVGMSNIAQNHSSTDNQSFVQASSSSVHDFGRESLHNYRVKWSPEVEKAFSVATSSANSHHESITKGFMSPPMTRVSSSNLHAFNEKSNQKSNRKSFNG